MCAQPVERLPMLIRHRLFSTVANTLMFSALSADVSVYLLRAWTYADYEDFLRAYLCNNLIKCIWAIEDGKTVISRISISTHNSRRLEWSKLLYAQSCSDPLWSRPLRDDWSRPLRDERRT